MTTMSQFADMTSSSIFFDVVLFDFSSLVTGASFMSISSLVLELGQKTWYYCFRKCGWRKKSLPGWPEKNLFYQFNWIFKIKFTLKKLLQQHFSLLKNKELYHLLFEGKKTYEFVRINLLLEIFLFEYMFFWIETKNIFSHTYLTYFRKQDYFFLASWQFFFYKELTRNSEIGNTPVWVLFNIWKLEQVRDTKFGINVSDEILLNAAKGQGYGFYRFWVIKGKPIPPFTQIRVNFLNSKLRHGYISTSFTAFKNIFRNTFYQWINSNTC